MVDIILVHGLWYRAWSLQLLKRRLRAQGYRVSCFSYATNLRAHPVNANQLAGFCRETCKGKFHLVGHSLGGLVILHMLGAHPEIRPGRVVLLGTPVKGSEVARRLVRSIPARALLGKAASPLAGGEPLFPPGLSVGMIAGTSSRGLGRLVTSLQKPNDGTVSVSETLSCDLTDHVQVPVSHTGMLFSRAVAEQAANFIEHGAFRRD